MSETGQVLRGTRALRRLLRQAVELRSLDVEGFRRWLTGQLAHWQKDPVFAQRARIRDLRRAHPELLGLERALRRATAADEASPHFARLQQLEQELTNTGLALSGLQAARRRAAPERHAALEEKLAAFRAKEQVLREERARLLRASPSRKAVHRARQELQQLREALGLEREEARLAELALQQGRRSGHSGAAFEQRALALTQDVLVPELLSRRMGQAADRVAVLTGVGLGAARTELDQLVILRPRRPGQPVEVLALVEVKRNLNDLAHGFRQRQENLAWLTGDTGHYAPAQYRTRHFRTGHFDREAVHEEHGERFVFARSSFRHFRRDPASHLFLGRLYFITRAGALFGASTAALARIRARVATDERWEPESDAYLRALLHWCHSLLEPLETPDVLRLYCASPGRGRQVLVLLRAR